MNITYFTHSLVSCWNHGNAPFLRGVLDELNARARVLAGHTYELRAAEVDAVLDRPAAEIGKAARQIVLEHHSARRGAQHLEHELEMAGEALRQSASRSAVAS